MDDPYEFGAIAAANSLSDIYAMGGKPFLALNIVCFPEELPKSILHQVLLGASDIAQEANVIIAGGHTVKDNEPKFGLSVTGTIHPEKIFRNNTAKDGDYLLLTKPIGTGIITTAAKAQVVNKDALDTAINSMRTLNLKACEVLQQVSPNSVTDVTGFGLIGHLTEMMAGSGTTATISFNQIPLLPQCLELAGQGIFPGGSQKNLDIAKLTTKWNDDLLETQKLILCDAQTSGGLLISVPPDKIKDLNNLFAKNGVTAALIGHVAPANDTNSHIVVTN